MVEGRAQPHVGAAVVADDREALVAEPAHQGHAVGGHRALGLLRMARSRGRLGRAAVAAQVRADHRVPPCQPRRHAVPGGVGARMPVQQQDRSPRAAVATCQTGQPPGWG